MQFTPTTTLWLVVVCVAYVVVPDGTNLSRHMRARAPKFFMHFSHHDDDVDGRECAAAAFGGHENVRFRLIKIPLVFHVLYIAELPSSLTPN